LKKKNKIINIFIWTAFESCPLYQWFPNFFWARPKFWFGEHHATQAWNSMWKKW